MLEKDIQRKILAFLKSLQGCFAYKIITANIAGLPDIACVLQGKAVFFEVKREGCKPTPLQLHQHGRLRDSGAAVFVVYSVADVKNALNSLGYDC